MQNFRMYIKSTENVYRMHLVQAGSFTEAIQHVEESLKPKEALVSCVRSAPDIMPIDDPFLAATLLDELINAWDHLTDKGYDTSNLSSILAGYMSVGDDTKSH